MKGERDKQVCTDGMKIEPAMNYCFLDMIIFASCRK